MEPVDFSTEDWINTAPEAFEMSEEANEELKAAAAAFTAVGKKYGLPTIAMAQTNQTSDGACQVAAEVSLISTGRAGWVTLLIESIASAGMHPSEAVDYILGAGQERENNAAKHRH